MNKKPLLLKLSLMLPAIGTVTADENQFRDEQHDTTGVNLANTPASVVAPDTFIGEIVGSTNAPSTSQVLTQDKSMVTDLEGFVSESFSISSESPGFSVGQKQDAIELLQLIPNADRTSANCQIAVGLFNEMMDEYWRVEIIKAIANIPADQRVDVIKHTIPLFNEKIYGYDRAETLKAVAAIPAEQRVNVIKHTIPLFNEKMDGYYRSDILRLLALIPDVDRTANNCQTTVGLFNEVMDGSDRANILKDIAKIPAEQRVDVINKAKHLLRVNIAYQQLYPLLKAMSYIPKSAIDKSFQLLESQKLASSEQFNELMSSSKVYIISFLISQDENLKTSIYNYWSECLTTFNDQHSTEHNKQAMKTMASFIFVNMEKLLLHEEHNLVQEAIRVQTILNGSTDPLNPFNFYDTMKQKRNQAIDYGNITVPTETIDGLKVSISPQAMLKIHQLSSTQQITSKDLPVVPDNFLKDMRNTLEKRATAEPLFVHYINQTTGTSLNSIITGSLGSNYLANLLNQVNTSPNHISKVAAQFIVLMSHINSLSDTVKSRDLVYLEDEQDKVGTKTGEEVMVSDRMEAFLQTLASIQACTVGKDSGINDAYNSFVPENKKLRSDLFKASTIEQVLYRVLQNTSQQMLTGNDTWLRSLIGLHKDQPVKQLSHQVSYIGNVIGPEMGLNLGIKFDNHTQTLYKDLVDLSKPELVQSFINRLTPHKLVYALQREINWLLSAPGSTFYSQLQSIFEDSDVLSKLLNIDINNNSVSLTLEGAIKLWSKLGILKMHE